MIVGHLAPALIPYARLPDTSLRLLLVCSMLPDFVWIGLGLLGLEAPVPSSVLEATFQNIRVEMTLSHDAVPIVLLAAAVAAGVFAVRRRRAEALWCGALIIGHLLADLLSGYPHHLSGPRSPEIGLALYHRAPIAALLVEVAFGAACVALYLRIAPRKTVATQRLALYAIFIIGALVWLPTATTPLGRLLHFSR